MAVSFLGVFLSRRMPARTTSVMILLFGATRAYVEDPSKKVGDQLVDHLMDPLLKVLAPRLASSIGTTSGVTGALRKIDRPRHCDDEEVDVRPTSMWWCGRRHASLVAILGGFWAVAAHPIPALAEEEEKLTPSMHGEFIVGPGGLKYRDLAVGTCETAQKGSTLTANYKLSLAATGAELKSDTNYLFAAGLYGIVPGFDLAVVGGKNMPAMRLGGKRQLIIPPALGYGANGWLCFPIKGCWVPPESTLELIIELIC